MPLIFDIETVPTTAAMAQPYPEADRNPPGNYKSDEAIAKWREADRSKWAEDRAKECSLNPRLGRIVAIGYQLGSAPVVEVAQTEEQEAWTLATFWDLVGVDGTIAGFNSHGFDFPFLVTRSLILGVPIRCHVPTYQRRYSYTPHFDTRMALTGWDQRASGTLSDWCLAFGIPAPEGKGSEVYEAYLAGDFDRIVAHCRSDVAATAALVERIAGTFQ